MQKAENRAICAECGGYCCKKCGCDYFVSDFPKVSKDIIEEELSSGRASIVAALEFTRTNNGKIIANPWLYLRARNKNRGEIDLLSFKTSCAALKEDGCSYTLDKRPSGGASFIPRMDEEGCFTCYRAVDYLEELKRWIPYQNILHKIVRNHTGMNTFDKLRQDVEELFYSIYTKNYKDVIQDELMEVRDMVPTLIECYPNEYKKARDRYNSNKVLIKKK